MATPYITWTQRPVYRLKAKNVMTANVKAYMAIPCLTYRFGRGTNIVRSLTYIAIETNGNKRTVSKELDSRGSPIQSRVCMYRLFSSDPRSIYLRILDAFFSGENKFRKLNGNFQLYLWHYLKSYIKLFYDH